MNTRSRKDKGKGFQNEVRLLLLLNFSNLSLGDIISTGMGQQGLDIVISPAARLLIPYSFECKRCLSLNIYKAILQSLNNAKDNTPVVVFRKNRMKPWVAIPFLKFLLLIKEQDEKVL